MKWNRLFEKQNLSLVIDFNSIFKNIFYINLETRKDRNEAILKEFSKYKISAKRVDGISRQNTGSHKINRGQLGCLLSHKKIIQEASKKHYDYILIFEDDVVFQNKSILRFHEYWVALPSDWDMFYLSGNNFMGLSKINELIYRTNGTLSTCAYAIRKKSYSKILSILNQKIYSMPIDSYYAELHRQINAYVCVPSIAYQKPDFSDIENRYVDYSFLK